MAKEEKLRSEIKDEYKWDLTRMYSCEEDFNADYNNLIKLIDELKSFRGIIAKDAETLLKYLKLEENANTILTNMYVYAYCKNDEDLSNKESQKRFDKVLDMLSMCSEATSFSIPELLKTDYEVIKGYIKENKKLEEYSFDLKEIYRYQPYVLTENEEKLISNISDLSNKIEGNFSIINNTMIDFGYIKDENNNDVKLTVANYTKYIKSYDRNVRRQAFEAKGKAYKKFSNLISNDYETYIKACSMIAKAKKYDSSMDMFLFPDGVTRKVYDTLLEVAKNNLNILHKYFRLKKEILNLDKLEAYDLSVPLVKDYKKIYRPEDAREIIVKALGVYGDEYKNEIKKLFDNRHIDFYPNKGKRIGYYENASSKDIIILGNYNDDFHSISSIAHELGHALHSYYSTKNNKPHLSEFSILIAEVASLTNEVLLANYVINNTDNKKLKLYALDNLIGVLSDNFFGTLSLGSIFEKEVHDRVFNGETLGEEDFNRIYENITNEHNGELVNPSEYSKYNWCRISHFYSPFYYYKYSIGTIGACYVSSKILSGDKEFLNKYIDFLKLGGSMMPLDELKTIGLDLNDPKIVNGAIEYINKLIDEFKDIYNS